MPELHSNLIVAGDVSSKSLEAVNRTGWLLFRFPSSYYYCFAIEVSFTDFRNLSFNGGRDFGKIELIVA